MTDIRLGKDGDIVVSEIGDISLTESVRQAVLIRLRWIYQEWRLGPEMGFPWFEEVFIKNPNTVKIQTMRSPQAPVRETTVGVTAAPIPRTTPQATSIRPHSR